MRTAPWFRHFSRLRFHEFFIKQGVMQGRLGHCNDIFQSGKSWKVPFRNPAGASPPVQSSVLAQFWSSPIFSAASENTGLLPLHEQRASPRSTLFLFQGLLEGTCRAGKTRCREIALSAPHDGVASGISAPAEAREKFGTCFFRYSMFSRSGLGRRAPTRWDRCRRRTAFST